MSVIRAALVTPRPTIKRSTPAMRAGELRRARMSKLEIGVVLARSRVGLLAGKARSLFGGRDQRER